MYALRVCGIGNKQKKFALSSYPLESSNWVEGMQQKPIVFSASDWLPQNVGAALYEPILDFFFLLLSTINMSLSFILSIFHFLALVIFNWHK